MIQPKIIIDDFSMGMLSDSTIQAKNGFSFGAGIDLFREPGILQVSQSLSAMAEAATATTYNITDRPAWMTQYNSANYVLGQAGRIYSTSASVWYLIHADATNDSLGQGMGVFDGQLYWAGDTNLGKFNGTDWIDEPYTFSASSEGANRRPMCEFGNKLYIGNEYYVAELDTASAFDGTALDLPQGCKIDSMAVYNNRLMIGARTPGGSNSALYSWDGASEDVENIWRMKESIISAMVNWRNYLIIFAGGKGNIYAFNGATLQKIKNLLPQLAEFETGWVLPGAVAEFKGNLIFGFGEDNWDYCGIYQIGNMEGLPMVMSHIPSKGLSDVQIYSLLQTGDDSFYMGWYDQTNCGIDTIHTTIRTVSSAYWESQIYDITPYDKSVSVNGIELVARPMAANTSVVIKYKLDNAADWTTLGTINSTNQGDVWRMKKQAKQIQVRLEFTCSGNNSPQIQIIKIY